MAFQIFFGSVLILISIVTSVLSFWMFERRLTRHGHWFAREPHPQRLMVGLGMAAIWVLAVVTADVWIWAMCFHELGVFESFETSVYFALVVFTTLGFGDVLLPSEWRLLAGLAATNGLLNIGLMTAILIDSLRFLRKVQKEHIKEQKRASKARRHIHPR